MRLFTVLFALFTIPWSVFAASAPSCADIFGLPSNRSAGHHIKLAMGKGLLNGNVKYTSEPNNLDLMFPNRKAGLAHTYSPSANQSEVVVGNNKLQIVRLDGVMKQAQLIVTKADGSSAVLKKFDGDTSEKDPSVRRIRLVQSGDEIFMIAPNVIDREGKAGGAGPDSLTYIYTVKPDASKPTGWDINLFSKLKTEADVTFDVSFNEFIPLAPGLLLNVSYLFMPYFSLINVKPGQSKEIVLGQFSRNNAYGTPVAVSGLLHADGSLFVSMVSRQQSRPVGSAAEFQELRQNNSSVLGNGSEQFDAVRLTTELTGSFDLSGFAGKN